jgi:hypothetical protein
MTRFLVFAAMLVILGVDFLALDDITTGRESSLTLEWAFLIISLPVLWALGTFVRRHRPENRTA